MKTISKRIVVFIVGSVVIVGTLAAYAHNRFYSAENRAEWIVSKVSDELNLDETQIAKLNVLKKELMTTRQKMHTEHQSTHAELLAMLDNPQLDRQKALSIIENKTQMLNQYAPNVVNAFGDFYDSLSEEQHKELREHITEMAEHREHHRSGHYKGEHHGEYHESGHHEGERHHNRHHD